MLTIEDLTFSYDGENFILDSFNASFEGPALHVILGPNGVGKSTLLKLIAGALRPTRGFIRLDGRPLGRGEVAYIPQDNELLPWLTVLSNVELPLRIAGVNGAERRLRALEALRAMGVEVYASRYPKSLSGGERKRVALARALASNSRVILLDEPTANLDPRARRTLWSHLRSLAREKLVIVVTHDVGEAVVEGDFISIMTGRPARIAGVFRGGEKAWGELGRIVEAYYGAPP